MRKIYLEGRVWNGLMKAVMATAAKDDRRPVLQGILVEVDGERARFTTLDGCCMASWEVALKANEGERGEKWSAIIPQMELKAAKTEPVSIEVENGFVTVRNIYRKTSATAQLLEGEFLEYRKVLPGERDECTIAFNPKLMRAVLEGLDDLAPADEKEHYVKMRVPRDGISPIVLGYECDEAKLTGLVLPVKLFKK